MDWIGLLLGPPAALIFVIILLGYCWFYVCLFVLLYIIQFPIYGSRKAQLNSLWICDIYWSHLIKIFEHWGRGQVYISGDVIPERETVFVIMNHRFFADWLACFQVAIRKGRLGAVRLFAKVSLRWVPVIGIGIMIIGFPLLTRDWGKDKKSISKVFHNLKTRRVPFWLASHVEGTRFSPEKLQQSQDYAKKNDLPILHNVLLPRKRGFVATVSELRDTIDAVYDITLVWNDGKKKPSLIDLALRRGMQLHVHTRRYPIAKIPTGEEEMHQWLLDRFKEKDALIDHLLQHGKFPNQLNEPFRHLPMNIS